MDTNNTNCLSVFDHFLRLTLKELRDKLFCSCTFQEAILKTRHYNYIFLFNIFPILRDGFNNLVVAKYVVNIVLL